MLPTGRLWEPRPPLQLSFTDISPRGQKSSPRSDLCTAQRGNFPNPLKDPRSYWHPGSTFDHRPSAHRQKGDGLPEVTCHLSRDVPFLQPQSTHVMQGRAPLCLSEHFLPPFWSAGPWQPLPLLPIPSPLTLAAPVPRRAMFCPPAVLIPSFLPT